MPHLPNNCARSNPPHKRASGAPSCLLGLTEQPSSNVHLIHVLTAAGAWMSQRIQNARGHAASVPGRSGNERQKGIFHGASD